MPDTGSSVAELAIPGFTFVFVDDVGFLEGTRFLFVPQNKAGGLYGLVVNVKLELVTVFGNYVSLDYFLQHSLIFHVGIRKLVSVEYFVYLRFVACFFLLACFL